MPDDLYRLSWEMVKQGSLWKYSNANPLEYKNTTQTVPNSEIPDDEWQPITKLDTNPHDQFNALKQWADADTGFVRNVTCVKVRIVEETVGEALS